LFGNFYIDFKYRSIKSLQLTWWHGVWFKKTADWRQMGGARSPNKEKQKARARPPALPVTQSYYAIWAQIYSLLYSLIMPHLVTCIANVNSHSKIGMWVLKNCLTLNFSNLSLYGLCVFKDPFLKWGCAYTLFKSLIISFTHLSLLCTWTLFCILLWAMAIFLFCCFPNLHS
jgi:hypothetical protein